MCKKVPFRALAKSAFRDSLVPGLPQIALAKSWRRAWLKGAVLAFSTLGLLYQTSEFLGLYYSFPSVIDMEVTIPDQVQQPAITICNINKRRRSVVCEKEECRCANESINVCDLHPRFCPGYHLHFKDAGYYLKIPDVDKCSRSPCLKMTWKQAIEEAHPENIIFSCKKSSIRMESTPCKKPYKRTPARETYYPYELNMCYTVETEVGNPRAEPVFHDSTFTVEMEFRTHGEEYLDGMDPPGILMSIHDPKALVNPYDAGFVIRGGMRYNAFVSMTEKTFLPPPYNTKCIDYLQKWREQGGTGPLNEKSCIEYCKMKKLEEKGECMDQGISYPHQLPVCEKGVFKLSEEIVTNCTLSCGNPCFDQIYTWTYEVASTFDCSFRERHEKNCGDNKTIIQVVFSRYVLTKVVYKPKYDSISLFGYLGGFIGIWIGISLVSLCDLLETLCYLAYVVFSRRRRNKPRKTKVVMHH